MQSPSSSAIDDSNSALDASSGSPTTFKSSRAGVAADHATSAAAGQHSPSARSKFPDHSGLTGSPHGKLSPTSRTCRPAGSPSAYKASPGRLSAAAAAAAATSASSSPSTVRPKLTVAQYQSASSEALQAEVQLVQDALCSCQAAYSKALADVNKSTTKIQQLQQQVK
jgi:hypothetical protein